MGTFCKVTWMGPKVLTNDELKEAFASTAEDVDVRPSCMGILGFMLGHKYVARYSDNTRYVHDVCVRCGHVVKRILK